MGKKAFPRATGTARGVRGLPAYVARAAGIAATAGIVASAGPDDPAPRRGAKVAAPVGSRRAAPIVMGVDPGTRVLGYGALVDAPGGARYLASGALRANARAAVPQRLATLQDGLRDVLARLRPDVVVVEKAFANRNVQAALRIGEGRGIALACAAACGATVVEMPPAAAKKAVVGHGAASKEQVARMVASALGLRSVPGPLDASDALALALAHAWRGGRRAALARARRIA